ncbi:MBL fold metallo-hydrolase [Micromonospora sp. NBC_01740]|uniref:MBL fold metallo-hydrolase n=1 Tax=Micromonospora sp. NBC_01740 TaxID=2975986 RepID=UPI002E154853|nr:MBL fold metallo-hydrolase [Micromonospora sp. NBC_01740]
MTASRVSEIAPGIFRVRDTCNVYVVRSPEGSEGPDGVTGRDGTSAARTAFAIDFGSGLALDHLAEMGIDRITDVLMTHHHRDQGQGLPLAVAAGIRIHVPPVERDLFADAEGMWQARTLHNDYNLRQDRFSLLESVPVHDVVPEYRRRTYAGTTVEVVPTPGHTTGSVTYLVERGGRRLAFTGDLVYAPGKVWSLAATQWSYTDNEGPAMTVLSCYQLMERDLDLLLPSHGEPMDEPRAALGLLATRMGQYVDSRRPYPWDLRDRLDNPFTALTEHLLLNRTSNSCSYVLLSETGAALVIDYGYDMTTGLPSGTDRASRRPWLASLPALRRNHGVTSIEVALPTHYHDDHVAGMNLLRDVAGTEIWAPENVAGILEAPMVEDLPCTWYDPIPVDRRLPLGEIFTWHEYEIMVHELPGHTLYAAAYEFVVDGVTVLVTSDQQVGSGVRGGPREVLNYQYRNRFRIGDYRASAELYRRVGPGLMVSGHWAPRWVTDDYLELLTEAGDELVRVHQDLLPLDEGEVVADGVLARIAPYYSRAQTGTVARFVVSVSNPRPSVEKAVVCLVLPVGWVAVPDVAAISLPPLGRGEIEVEVTLTGPARRRARMAVDVSIGDLHLGQHAEALVDVTEAGST